MPTVHRRQWFATIVTAAALCLTAGAARAERATCADLLAARATGQSDAQIAAARQTTAARVEACARIAAHRRQLAQRRAVVQDARLARASLRR